MKWFAWFPTIWECPFNVAANSKNCGKQIVEGTGFETTNERAAQWCDERMLVIFVISNAHLWLKFDGRHFSFGCYRWVPLYVWRVLVTEHCGKAHISSTARWLWDRFYFPRRMTSFIARGNFIDDVQFNEFIEFLFLFLFFSMTLAIPERCCCRWSTPIDVAYN